MIREELQLNHTYLLKYKFSNTLSSITILLITGKAYHIRWNRGIESTDTWEEKEHLHGEYTLVEDVSDYMKTIEFNNIINKISVETELENCPSCNGTGYIEDNTITSGVKICPQCLGSKLVTKVVKIS